MQSLQIGSVILFGSCKSEGFILDTVLVVDEKQDYTAETTSTLRSQVSQTYADVTLSRLPYNIEYLGRGAPLTFYSGVTWEQHRTGMLNHHSAFSFFPCKPVDEASEGFARPTIELPGYIRDKQPQGRCCTPVSNPAKMLELWEDVRDQVLRQGLYLGVWAQLPPKVDSVQTPSSAV